MTASREEAQRMRATGSSRETGSWPHEMAGEPGGLDEEFLYHLSRGSEFLIANQVVQAKEELERALAFHPLDARSQDLLASVYFRLGVYPRAIEIWTNLVQTHGEDVALRVNLGLALLKTAQPDQALGHLARAVARDPTHERAWRYVGLAEWRVGNLDRARDAFLRGGQASMARRMEEMLGSSVGQIVSQEAAPYIESTRLSLSPPALGIGPDAEPAAAPVVVLGAESIPPSAAESVTRRTLAPAPLPSMLPADLMPEVHAPPGRVSSPPGALMAGGEGEERFALTHDGTLVLRPRRPILARQRGLRALVGSLPADPMPIPELESDGDPFYRFAGQRVLYFTSSATTSASGAVDRFELLRLESESFVVRATALFAFDEQLTIERTARAAALGEGASIELRGSGLCALSVQRTMAKLSVQASDEVRVELDALIGFTGPLFLGEIEGRWVTLRGEGVVFFV
jgi:hypothetical protein